MIESAVYRNVTTLDFPLIVVIKMLSIVLTGINVCASFRPPNLSGFPQKRQLYLKSNTFDTD